MKVQRALLEKKKKKKDKYPQGYNLTGCFIFKGIIFLRCIKRKSSFMVETSSAICTHIYI